MHTNSPVPAHVGSPPQLTQPDLERLPMLLWLRGDEPETEEFTIDADHAMALLSIKRTRLTQIAGRELRVARRRVDKYVRPFFRLIDIEAYLAWSRAPATQAHTTQFLQSAMAKVSEEIQELSETMATQVLQRQLWTKPIEEEKSEVTWEYGPWFQSLQHRLQSMQETLNHRLDKQQHHVSQNVQSIRDELRAVTEVADQAAQQWSLGAHHMKTELDRRLQPLQSELAALTDALALSTAPLAEKFSLMERQIAHYGQQVEQTFAFLLAAHHELSDHQGTMATSLREMAVPQTHLKPKRRARPAAWKQRQKMVRRHV